MDEVYYAIADHDNGHMHHCTGDWNKFVVALPGGLYRVNSDSGLHVRKYSYLTTP